MDQNKAKVNEFFSRFFDTSKVSDNTDIFTGGYVNSLFAMQLIGWLEKEFGIEVDDSDLQLSNFNSLDAVIGFVGRKQAAGTFARA